MLKLLILSRYDRRGASSRLRSLQYVPYFEAAGLEVTVASFFDGAYLDGVYGGRAAGLDMLRYFARRLRQLCVHRADVVLLEKEMLPWVPAFIECALLPRGIPLVVDYDDAVFHRYDAHRSPLVRAVLGDKIDRVMRYANVVLAGNPYLAARARKAGARQVELVPTVVDTEHYGTTRRPCTDGRLRIGWIGTPETWLGFGNAYAGLLGEVVAAHKAVVRAVGAGPAETAPKNFEFLPWSEASEVELIQGMDIGIMPLAETPWARGKCGYKLIQYMACGVPVVASPVGVNVDIVTEGTHGFLARDDAEWRKALATLLSDGALRARMGAAGRARVEAHYALQVYGPKVAALLAGLAAQGGQHRGALRRPALSRAHKSSSAGKEA